MFSSCDFTYESLLVKSLAAAEICKWINSWVTVAEAFLLSKEYYDRINLIKSTNNFSRLPPNSDIYSKDTSQAMDPSQTYNSMDVPPSNYTVN